MATLYPDAIDGQAQVPLTVDRVTPINADLINAIRSAVIAIETELGIQPRCWNQWVDRCSYCRGGRRQWRSGDHYRQL